MKNVKYKNFFFACNNIYIEDTKTANKKFRQNRQNGRGGVSLKAFSLKVVILLLLDYNKIGSRNTFKLLWDCVTV